MEIEACAKCAEGTEEDFEPFGTSFAGGEEPLTCPCCGGEFWSLVLLESRPTKHAPDVVESAAASAFIISAQQGVQRTDATYPPCEIARECYFGQDGKCLRGGVCR